jgi:hypothetical protein
MRKLFVVFSIVLSLSVLANAQDKPKVEVFGGYSILASADDRTGHGWHGSVAANLNSWFGLVLDVSGHYDSESFSSGIGPFFSSIDRSDHSFHIGPRFTYRGNEKVTPFGHVLIGGVRQHRDEVSSFGSLESNNTSNSTLVGGGLDVKLSKKIALRLVQADYVFVNTRFNEHNGRVSTGLVVRF